MPPPSINRSSNGFNRFGQANGVSSQSKSVFDFVKETEPLRPTVRFAYLEKVYAKTTVSTDDSGEVGGARVEWTLWRGHIEFKDLGLLIYDEKGVVNERTLEYALKVVEDEIVQRLEDELPDSIKRALEKSYSVSGLSDLKEEGKLVKPVPRLRDPSYLRRINWKEDVIENVFNYKGAVEYEPLIIVRKATSLRGVAQAVNPHAIVVLPGQTGKTDGYRVFAIVENRFRARVS